MLIEICEFLANRSSFVRGTNLCVNQYLQGSPDRCAVALNITGGEVNLFITDYKIITIQFNTRDKDWKISRDDADIIRDVFTAMAHVDLPQVDSGPEYRLLLAHPESDTIFIGEDEKGRKEHSISIKFHIKNKE